MAGGPGFEPRLTESESAVLPLNYPPIRTPYWDRRAGRVAQGPGVGSTQYVWFRRRKICPVILCLFGGLDWEGRKTLRGFAPSSYLMRWVAMGLWNSILWMRRSWGGRRADVPRARGSRDGGGDALTHPRFGHYSRALPRASGAASRSRVGS